jgi:hypothetical protein
MRYLGKVLPIIAALTLTLTLGVGAFSAAAATTPGRSGAAVATSGNSGRASPHASTTIRDEPLGCPTPDPTGYLCDYFEVNGGANDICFDRQANVANWGSLTGPGGQNCHTDAKSLVNTHNDGDVVLWSGTSYSGQEGCISAASYYDNLADNYYPNGSAMAGNIDSSQFDVTGVC